MAGVDWGHDPWRVLQLRRLRLAQASPPEIGNMNFLIGDLPCIQLSSGLVVANFSSPHSFAFATGEVLEACSEERSKRGELGCKEIESRYLSSVRKWIDIEISFSLSESCSTMLWEAFDLSQDGRIDVCLVPLPVLQILRTIYTGPIGIRNTPFRCIRTADRIKKTIYPDRFCI